MSSKLNSFADLMKVASEEKKTRVVNEKIRIEKEISPLLSELFSVVAKGKNSPILVPKSLETISKKEVLVPITELVKNVEEKVTQILSKSAPDDQEKRFLNIFNKLQDDFQNLKKYVEGKSSSGWGSTSGGGEVRVLRMDDVLRETPLPRTVMTWDATLNKIRFLPITTDDAMPYSKRVDFVGDYQIYRGEAEVGSPEGSSVWRLRRIDIGSDGDIIEVYANGNSNYTNIWSDRVNYAYA